MVDPLNRYLVVVDVGEKSADYAWHIIDTEVEYKDDFLFEPRDDYAERRIK